MKRKERTQENFGLFGRVEFAWDAAHLLELRHGFEILRVVQAVCLEAIPAGLVE